jgi:hypothetical protein
MRWRRLLLYGLGLLATIVVLAILLRVRGRIYMGLCDAGNGETVLTCVRQWQGLASAILLLLLGLGLLFHLRGQLRVLKTQGLLIRRQFAEHMRQTTESDRRVVLRETTRVLDKLDKSILRISEFEKDVEQDSAVSNDPVQALRTRLSQLESIAAGDSLRELSDYLSEEEAKNIRELNAELRVQISLLDKVLPKFQTALATLKPESQEHRRMMRQVYAEMQNLHLSKQETVLARARALFDSLSALRSSYQNAWYMTELQTV